MNEVYKKLTQLINDYKKIIIMTHKNPDLDGMSSSIILYNIINSFDKEVYVYQSKEIKNTSLIKMNEKINKSNKFINYLNIDNYKEVIDASTLLIILDVNKISLLENCDLIDYTNNIIVVDHHIRPKDYIRETLLTYINSRLSSIAEFITYYLKYLNKYIDSLLATILLAAIEIDTNSFNIKTSEDTYEAAAFLMKLGADNVEKQEILQENKKEYLKRQDLLKNSFMLNKNIAMCIFDNCLYKKEELAITAEELLQFEDVEASFVIAKTDNNKVSISARSLGKIDVENIMNQMGGGGHLTEAAAEIDGNDMKEVKSNLIHIINEVKECK